MALSAQENAYAERINKTIKNDYIERWKPKSFSELKRMIKRAVINYNHVRTHNAIQKMTPVVLEKQCSLLASQQRTTMTIFNNEIIT